MALGGRTADVEVVFSDAAAPESWGGSPIYRGPALVVSRTDSEFQFRYDDAQFLVSGDGNRVVAATSPGSSHEDTCTYLVGPVLGFVLRLRGMVCLHSSVVVLDGFAVALCGEPRAGKSTSAAAFAQLGYPVLAEDVGALQEGDAGFIVQPGYPRVNLWPDAAASLFGESGPLPAITPNWGKRYLGLARPPSSANAQSGAGHPAFHSEPARLGAIYILEDRIPQPAAFRPLAPMDALLALARNTYSWYLLDPAMRAREFGVLQRLVRAVPVRGASASDGVDGIRGFCTALLEDFRREGGRNAELSQGAIPVK